MDPEPRNTLKAVHFPQYSMVCLCRMIVAVYFVVQFHRAEHLTEGSNRYNKIMHVMRHLGRLVNFVVKKIHNELISLTGFSAADVHNVLLLTVLEYNILYIEHDLAFATRQDQLPFPGWLIVHCRLVREEDLHCFRAMVIWAFQRSEDPFLAAVCLSDEEMLLVETTTVDFVMKIEPIPALFSHRTVDQQRIVERDTARHPYHDA